MDSFLLRRHQSQVEHQCFGALMALDIMQHGLTKINSEGPGSAGMDIFWSATQSFLNATANISKTLWGQGRSKSEITKIRKPLRESLAIREDSPLANTDLRNHFEHFDERLDRWFETSKSHNYVDFNIGPKEFFTVGVNKSDIFRQFDPEVEELVFWGESYPIGPIRQALIELHATAKREANKFHRT